MKTQVLPITPESVALAARLLQQGELVALPTETVYGIAADARNGEAVKKIFEAYGQAASRLPRRRQTFPASPARRMRLTRWPIWMAVCR